MSPVALQPCQSVAVSRAPRGSRVAAPLSPPALHPWARLCRLARGRIALLATLVVTASSAVTADPLPLVPDVEVQPLAAQVKRLLEGL